MQSSQLIFLDTEFTSFEAPKLISIGMAAFFGEEFYAEVPFSKPSINPFVRDVVVPLLNKDAHAHCEYDGLHVLVRNWLSIVKAEDRITLCFDSRYDEVLLKEIFDGNPPAFLDFRNVNRNINELLRYEFHKKNNLPEHHALNDALAMRYAFRELKQDH